MAGRKFADEEEITNRGSSRLAVYAQLAQLFDHFDPPSQFDLVDHVNALIGLSKADRALVYALALRLEKP